MYDFEELRTRAADAGIGDDGLCRSDRGGQGLPAPLARARERAVNPRNASLACWLDQEVREDESLYAHVTKRRPSPPLNRSFPRPYCRPVRDWWPCPSGVLEEPVDA